MTIRNHTLRNGRKMAYTGGDGAPHPESFWCLGPHRIDPDEQVVTLRFRAWHDATAYDEGRQPIYGAEKEYMVTGEGFLTAVSTPTVHPTGTPISVEVLDMAWQVALSIEDVIVPAVEEGAQPTHRSFFADAVPV